jgi:hypothetical protein
MTTIDRYRSMLPVLKHRLDDELEIQAQVMDELSRQVVTLNSRMIEAKDDLARIEGRIAEDIRDDEPKLTVGGVDAKVKRDPTRTGAWQVYQKARSDHEEWSGLLEAWRHKGYSIKTLADLYAAQYFSLDSHQSREKHPAHRHSRANDDTQSEARAEIRRAGAHSRSELSKEPEAPVSTRRRGLL